MQEAQNEIGHLRRELERLSEIEQRFEDFANSTRDFAFITLDLNGAITGWNKGAEQLLGYSAAEIIGQSGGLFFTPEDRATGEPEQEMEAARVTGRAEDDRWHCRKDGTRFWGSGVMTLLRDQGGAVRGYAKVMRDQTDLRKRIQALHASEERFRLLVENVRDCALFSVDTEGRITDWNPGGERIFGYTGDEAVGLSAINLVVDEQSKKELEDDFARAATQDGAGAECWMVRKDGSRFYARWVTNAIRDEDGVLLGYMKVLRDETERKREDDRREKQAKRERELLEGQVHFTNMVLHRTNEELQDLAGQLLNAQDQERREIARDLHDHMAQRIGLMDMKLAGLQQAPDVDAATLHSDVAQVREQVSELLADMRDLSYRLHPSTLEHLGLLPALRSLLEDVNALRSQPVLLGSDNFFEDALAPELKSVLYRISEEALRNVVRHAGDVPVTITLSRNSGSVHLRVQDGGPGFSRDAVEGRRTLGFISMEERARSIGGRLEVNSAPGEGTVVEVVVPVSNASHGSATSSTSGGF